MSVCKPTSNRGIGVLRVVIITGEVSGDILGAQLMRSIRESWGGPVLFRGVGGADMTKEGLRSIFPMTDLSIIGISGLLKKFFLLMGRLREAVDLILSERPDVVVMIDNPAFTHRVAERVRRRMPKLAIVNYVPPALWVWGRWRIKAMDRCFDRILSIFPFEPDFFSRHSRVPCAYVGHPQLVLCEQKRMSSPARRTLLILPGSRRCEVESLMPIFGQVIGLLEGELAGCELVLPTLPHLRSLVEAHAENWSLRPAVCVGDEERYALMRHAHLALAASGTVTLELGLCGVPMVVAYKKSSWEAFLLRRFVYDKDPMLAMANIILGRRVVPECIQEACTSSNIARELGRLLRDPEARARVRSELRRLRSVMLRSVSGETPGDLVLRTIEEKAGSCE